MTVTTDTIAATTGTMTATCDTHGELSEEAGTLYVWRKPDGSVGRTKCRACERAKKGTTAPAGERRTRRTSRQATSPTAHLAGPTRESVLSLLEALDTARNALGTNDSSRQGESPLQHAHRIANERKGALAAVVEQLTAAADAAGLAGLMDSNAPVVAAVGAE